MNVTKGNDLHISAPDRVGLLADVAGRLKSQGINILGISAYHRDKVAWLIMHTSDPVKTADILRDFTVKWQEVLVIECPTGVGSLAQIAGKLSAAGINILYSYGSVGDDAMARLIVDTANNDKALELLKQL